MKRAKAVIFAVLTFLAAAGSVMAAGPLVPPSQKGALARLKAEVMEHGKDASACTVKLAEPWDGKERLVVYVFACDSLPFQCYVAHEAKKGGQPVAALGCEDNPRFKLKQI